MTYSAKNVAELLFGDLKLSSTARFYVAYSGGVDSTVLLHLCKQAQVDYGFELTALHVNHRLQAQSDEWAKHCQNVCHEWDIPYLQTTLELPDNSELTARNARYQWFSKQLGPTSVLLTAHHKQDRAETLLFNLMRGAGVRGLSSLRPVRAFNGAKIVRPLLDLSRQQVKSYAQDNQLPWVEDPSNQRDEYSRNHIRQHVLPALTEFRSDAIQNIARAAANLDQESALLNEVAICDLVEVRELAKHPLDQSYAICYDDISRRLSPARQANLIRFWLRSLQSHTPSKRLMRQLIETFDGSPSSTTILQEEGCQFRFYQGYMYVMPAEQLAEPQAAIDWQNINQPIDLYNDRLRVDATSKLRNLIIDRRPSQVRLAPRPYLHNPKALQGHSLNLKNWLRDIGVPPWRRRALPLLTLNHSNTDVVLGPIDQQLQSDWVSMECPLN